MSAKKANMSRQIMKFPQSISLLYVALFVIFKQSKTLLDE